jgi:hypothetical protein
MAFNVGGWPSGGEYFLMQLRARIGIVSIVGVALLCGVLTPLTPTTAAPDLLSSPGPSGPLSGGTGPLANATDRAEADRLEQVIDWHIWNRAVYEIEYKSTARDPNEGASTATGVRYPGVGQITDTTDSGLWTGTYLAALAFKYQVAQAKLAQRKLSSTDRKYWETQRWTAILRARPLVEQYHVKVNISKAWKAPPPDPHIPPTQQGNNYDTGIAPYPGREAGLLFRSCIPADAEARLTFKKRADGSWEKDTVYGPLLWDHDGHGAPTPYYCEDGTSRDTYAGTTFGLVTAFDMFGDALGNAEQPGVTLHQQIGSDLMLLTDFLVRHGWSTPRPHSKISSSNDLSSFYSPLFLYTPGAKVHMAQIARHVADQIGTPEQKLEFDALWQAEANGDDPFEAFSSELDAADKLSQYYKWNLGHLIAFDVIRLEPDKLERDRIKTGIAIMDASTRSDVNAHFEAITYSMTGDPARLDASVAHLRQWRDYRAAYEGTTQGRYNSHRCAPDFPGGDLTCVPQGQKNVAVRDPFGMEQVTTVSDGSTTDCKTHANNAYFPTNCRSATILPIAERVPTDFLWQRPPYQLDSDRAPTHESQGIDYLLPYWMLRYYTEVAPPASEPFPYFPGPYFK